MTRRAWKILRGASVASTAKVIVGAVRAVFFWAASGETSNNNAREFTRQRERALNIHTSEANQNRKLYQMARKSVLRSERYLDAAAGKVLSYLLRRRFACQWACNRN